MDTSTSNLLIPYRLPSRTKMGFDMIQSKSGLQFYNQPVDDESKYQNRRANTNVEYYFLPNRFKFDESAMEGDFDDSPRYLSTRFQLLNTHRIEPYTGLRLLNNRFPLNHSVHADQQINCKESVWIDELKRWTCMNHKNIEYLQLCKTMKLHGIQPISDRFIESNNICNWNPNEINNQTELNNLISEYTDRNESESGAINSTKSKASHKEDINVQQDLFEIDSIKTLGVSNKNTMSNEKCDRIFSESINSSNASNKFLVIHHDIINHNQDCLEELQQNHFESNQSRNPITHKPEFKYTELSLNSEDILIAQKKNKPPNLTECNNYEDTDIFNEQMNIKQSVKVENTHRNNIVDESHSAENLNCDIVAQTQSQATHQQDKLVDGTSENGLCESLNEKFRLEGGIKGNEDDQPIHNDNTAVEKLTEEHKESNMGPDKQKYLQNSHHELPRTTEITGSIRSQPKLFSRSRVGPPSFFRVNAKRIESKENLFKQASSEEIKQYSPENIQEKMETKMKFKIIPPDMTLPALPALPLQKIEPEPIKPIQIINTRDQPMNLLRPRKQRWGPKQYQENNYVDSLERERLIEQRRARAIMILKKMRERRRRQNVATNKIVEGPRFESYGFLAKYCILTNIDVNLYRGTFEVCDEEKKKWLSTNQLKMALKGVNPNLQQNDYDYLNLIMHTCGYSMKDGADFKIFSILAALSVRIAEVDDWVRNFIDSTNYRALERKTYFCRKLWESIVEPMTNKLPMEKLYLELRAGGVKEIHIKEVKNRLEWLRELNLIDFLIYVPLFTLIHTNIIDNPFDVSEKI